MRSMELRLTYNHKGFTMASSFEFKGVQGFKGVTPSGAVKWAKVIDPDYNFVDNGQFSIDLVYDELKHADLILKLQGTIDAAFEEVKAKVGDFKAKSLVKADPLRYDKNDGTPYFKFKSDFKRLDTKTNQVKEYRPTIVGASGAQIVDPQPVGNGSICKVSYYCFPYYMASSNTVGISLKLNGVQIIKHNLYVNNDFGDASAEAEEYEEVI